MKYLVISDIHANKKALLAVFKDSVRHACEGLICLGDITGYGPHPNECIEIIQSSIRNYQKSYILLGNHDAVLLGTIPKNWFREALHASIDFTQKKLSKSSSHYLETLQPSAQINATTWAFHGSPHDPTTEYLLGDLETDLAIKWLIDNNATTCFFGHTHEALFFKGIPNKKDIPTLEKTYQLYQPTCINPGSLGLPRHFLTTMQAHSHHAHAATIDVFPITEKSYPAYYAVWDSAQNSISWHETRYNHRSMQRYLHSSI